MYAKNDYVAVCLTVTAWMCPVVRKRKSVTFIQVSKRTRRPDASYLCAIQNLLLYDSHYKASASRSSETFPLARAVSAPLSERGTL